ncbi:MAG: hypothetical protein HY951_16520 [Bacteroidia bacterium]|nr:hypothetical protein [Bacteroidia bacterium]
MNIVSELTKRCALFYIPHLFAFILISCVNNQNSNLFAQIQPQDKAWYKTILQIPTPLNYVREKCDTMSYEYYLQNLPLKTNNNVVYLYNKSPKFNQSAQFAVIKMDVGSQDLQQCADAVMRLRAEYLFNNKKYNEIHFNFLSDGKPRYYKDYCNGDHSFKKYRSYMNYIFSFANTASLKKELKRVENIKNIRIGDVFIVSGNPYGHAVTVVDVAKNKDGKIVFMIAQSYMPAQEIHVLKNPDNSEISPWYDIDFGDVLQTPEWTFGKEDLYRFP